MALWSRRKVFTICLKMWCEMCPMFTITFPPPNIYNPKMSCTSLFLSRPQQVMMITIAGAWHGPEWLLINNDVRSHSQDCQCGHQCEGGKEEETEAVKDHRGKLPVSLDSVGDLVIFYLVRDNFYLLIIYHLVTFYFIRRCPVLTFRIAPSSLAMGDICWDGVALCPLWSLLELDRLPMLLDKCNIDTPLLLRLT